MSTPPPALPRSPSETMSSSPPPPPPTCCALSRRNHQHFLRRLPSTQASILPAVPAACVSASNVLLCSSSMQASAFSTMLAAPTSVNPSRHLCCLGCAQTASSSPSLLSNTLDPLRDADHDDADFIKELRTTLSFLSCITRSQWRSHRCSSHIAANLAFLVLGLHCWILAVVVSIPLHSMLTSPLVACSPSTCYDLALLVPFGPLLFFIAYDRRLVMTPLLCNNWDTKNKAEAVPSANYVVAIDISVVNAVLVLKL
ncbi:hypothetical protein EDD15DRAFT_2369148 [Pisolithus albus]|nr:hypothetical protein EDD15DRAFT_2369148 [Pisolithus albus]